MDIVTCDMYVVTKGHVGPCEHQAVFFYVSERGTVSARCRTHEYFEMKRGIALTEEDYLVLSVMTA